MGERIKITDEIKFLLEEAIEKVGSKSRLARELGYPVSKNKIVNQWLSGRIKTIPSRCLERLMDLLEC